MNNPITTVKPCEFSNDRSVIEIDGRWFQVPNKLLEYIKAIEPEAHHVDPCPQCGCDMNKWSPIHKPDCENLPW